MAVLNPPRTLPGLGRAIVNHLLDARRSATEEDLVAAFKPDGLNADSTAADGVKNTISSMRAIDVLVTNSDGTLGLGENVPAPKTPFTRDQFRRVLQGRVFDLSRDGDVWVTQPGDAHTSGARDLNRALAWVMAQDALGQPLSWTDNLQKMQAEQFQTNDQQAWAITNDTRWNAASRWLPTLGLATQSVIRDQSGLVPLPVTAVDDALASLPDERIAIHDLLTRIGQAVPVLHGGTMRAGLVSVLGIDPDPGIAAECADSSIGQALRILEERGRVKFETLPDAHGIRLSRFDATRRTHAIVKAGGKK
ncbi:protein DpdG [Nocardioides sp. W7]|uniref:protein DpdG n=1 Tax=Nocardioides sp. W7 TaxID=2931390 RepID=UPI001FD5681F|nr:protein DpdG [Nocardioides sp. W7]